ncbi:MAG: hypothetical protein ACK5MG_05835 [Bacteroidales bacterium]
MLLGNMLLGGCAKSDSDFADNKVVKNEFEYNKTNDKTFANDLKSFISSDISSLKSLSSSETFDFSNQETLSTTTTNESVVLLSSPTNPNEKMIFYRISSTIKACLRYEILDMTEGKSITFICKKGNGTPIMKANFDFVTNTYKVLDVYAHESGRQKSAMNKEEQKLLDSTEIIY